MLNPQSHIIFQGKQNVEYSLHKKPQGQKLINYANGISSRNYSLFAMINEGLIKVDSNY